MYSATACGGDAQQICVDIGEEVVGHFSSSYHVDGSLMVVSHLMAGSPYGSTCGGERVVVEHGAQSAIAVIGAISGGIHIAVVDGEGIPDVAEPTFQFILESHELFFALYYLAPYAHQALHLIVAFSKSTLYQVVSHHVYDVLALHVHDVALVQKLFAQQHPVLVGHSSCEVEIALEFAAFDVNLHVWIVGQVFLWVIQLIEDV